MRLRLLERLTHFWVYVIPESLLGLGAALVRAGVGEVSAIER
jgi:hypothetical protein